MTDKIQPKICKIVDRAQLPERMTPKSACYDVRACFHKDQVKVNGSQKIDVTDHGGGRQINIFSGDRALIPTGLIIIPPEGYKVSVKPRSGMAFKMGVTVINTPGTIDEDYSNETFVLLVNHNDRPIRIVEGDRIAQIEIEPVCTDDVEFNIIGMDDVLDYREKQERKGGIGHTGTK